MSKTRQISRRQEISVLYESHIAKFSGGGRFLSLQYKKANCGFCYQECKIGQFIAWGWLYKILKFKGLAGVETQVAAKTVLCLVYACCYCCIAKYN